MSGMTAIMSESGLNDSVTVNASGINNPTQTNTGCNVSYSQSSLQGNQIIANYTGDYLQIVNPGYYIVTMACTNHNSNINLLRLSIRLRLRLRLRLKTNTNTNTQLITNY